MRFHRLCGALLLCISLLGCGGGGGGGGPAGPGAAPATPPPPPTNTPSTPNAAPTVSILASGDIRSDATSADLHATVGGVVSLSGGTSTDPDGDALSFRWTITSRPPTSTLALAAETNPLIEIRPDVQGTYVLSLRVTDARESSTDRSITIVVDNSPPNASVVVSANFQSTPVTHATRSVSVGSLIVVDATATTDPDGDPVTITFAVVEQPASSLAILNVQGRTGRLTADALGVYRVRVRGQDPSGAFYESVHVFNAENRAPQAVMIASITPVPFDSGSTHLSASAGYLMVLDGSFSSDPEAGALTHTWELLNRPDGSTTQLQQTSGTSTQFLLDELGTYLVRLMVVDPQGGAAYYTTQVDANNRRPTADVTSNATPVALPTGPAIRVPPNTDIALRGTGSTDADGDPLTYAWSLVLSPDGNMAGLSTPTAAMSRLIPQLPGNYIVRLRVTDPVGAYSERDFSIAVGNYEPAAITDKFHVSALIGTPVTVSAAMSFDNDGDVLSYAWDIDVQPATSNATINSPASPVVTFTPDVPGIYVLNVDVSDGVATSFARVTVKAMTTIAQNVQLNFAPLDMLYSRSLDLAVIVGANPNRVTVVNPYSGMYMGLALPAAVNSFKLSPNGRLAAFLHDTSVTLYDVQTATILRETPLAEWHGEVFLFDSGIAYLTGRQGSDEIVRVLNLRTGEQLAVRQAYLSGGFRGVLANRHNRFLMMTGYSPADIISVTYDPVTHQLLSSHDSPYHGDYPIGPTLYLTGNQNIVFTSAGNYFYSDTLSYAGTLGNGDSIQHMNHSTSADEALVLWDSVTSGSPTSRAYPSSYSVYSGTLFNDHSTFTLPQVEGEQAYALKIFHTANDDHVALVQTGSNEPLAAGIEYHLVVR